MAILSRRANAALSAGTIILLLPVPKSLSLSSASVRGTSTTRKRCAVTGAKATVVGTSPTGSSASGRQVASPTRASRRGLTSAPMNGIDALGAKNCAERIVCGRANASSTVRGASALPPPATSRSLAKSWSSGWP